LNEELILVAPPEVEPISVEEFRAFVRFDSPAEDSLIAELITAARETAEKFTRRSFITTQWLLKLDGFGWFRKWRLHRSPVRSIDSITYIDDDGAEQTVDPDKYSIQGLTHLVRNRDYSWPSTDLNRTGTVSIAFTAGYGDDPQDVPATIRAALKFLVSHYWETRKPEDRMDVPMHVEAMLARHRAL
jgi:uncharacterized phiE125 gp8 family phage protein